MNKENLYYILRKGTNDRLLREGKHPLIVKKSAIGKEVNLWNTIGGESEAISIEEYEETFEGEDEEEMVDIRAEEVEILISKDGDGIWVNIPRCVCRIQGIEKLHLIDNRPK